MGNLLTGVPDKTQAELPAPFLRLFNPEIARTIPYWFFAAVGLVFASGFVVVELYLETFGLRDVGADFWKPRYIHVGALCSVLPLLPVLSVALFSHAQKQRQHARYRPMIWLRFTNGMMFYLVPQIAFYVLIVFGRRAGPGDSHFMGFDRLWIILVLFILGPLLYLGIEKLSSKPNGRWKILAKRGNSVAAALRVLFNLLMGWELCALFYGYRRLLWELLRNHAFPLSAFLICTIGIPLFPILRRRYAGQPATTGGYPNLGALSVCVCIPIYYLSLVTFASSIFPYLPASRGGGDYSVAPLVTVKLKPDFTRDAVTTAFLEPETPPADVPKTQPKSKNARAPNTPASDAMPSPTVLITVRCVLIEETAAALFIALPSDAGGAEEWRKSQAKRPNVLAIDRKSILAVAYDPPKL